MTSDGPGGPAASGAALPPGSPRPNGPALQATVVVPAHNAAGTLGESLAALAAQEWPGSAYEIILVDDGSTDNTAAVAEAAGVTVIRQANAGPAAARNRGAAAAQGDLLCFTDADCAPESGWLRALAGPFDDPKVAGAKGAYLTYQREIVPRFTQQEYEERYDRMAQADAIDFVDTYSAAYRKEIFAANGGFDTIFPTASVEDQEFSFRLAQKGYRLVFVPDARVYHRHNPTLQAYARRKYRIGYWKALIARWHPDRMVRDSHTPQILKAQMALAALAPLALAAAIGVSLLLGRAWRAGWAAAALVAVAFTLTTLPFLARVWRRDRAVTLPAAGLLWVRAWALGAGFAVGLVRFAAAGDSRRPALTGPQRLVKRAGDIGVGAATLALAAAPMALIALGVKLSSPGPVFFRQTRIGQGGRPFRIYKFRTMVVDAPERLAEALDLDALAEPVFKLRRDPRVTRFGAVLRRWSLDELPQLMNVLAGDMSVVGPRPEEEAVVARYSDAQRRRLVVKPGMTGPMQISGRGDLTLDQRLALELAYIDGYSLLRDLTILARTPAAVIRGNGAY